MNKDSDYFRTSDGQAIAINSIVAIGEMITELGPQEEDHFAILVLRDGTWHGVPFLEACTCFEFQAFMKQAFGADLVARLANTTSFCGVVNAPNELQGVSLFETPVSDNDHRRWWRLGAKPMSLPMHLSSELKAWIGTLPPDRSP